MSYDFGDVLDVSMEESERKQDFNTDQLYDPDLDMEVDGKAEKDTQTKKDPVSSVNISQATTPVQLDHMEVDDKKREPKDLTRPLSISLAAPKDEIKETKSTHFSAEHKSATEAYTINLRVSKHPDPAKAGWILLRPELITTHIGPLPPKNIVLVLDRSGSMTGEPTRQLKDATQKFLVKLNAKDKVTIIGFDGEAKVYGMNCSPTDAQRHLQEMPAPAKGGTNISGALEKITPEMAGSVNNASIILLTDGEINRGPTDPQIIMQRVRAQLKQGMPRIIPIGLGCNYTAETMDSFGRATGFPHIYLKDEKAIQTFLTEAPRYIGNRTLALQCQININGNYLTHEAAAPCGYDYDKAWSQVIELPISDLQQSGVNCDLTYRIGDYTFKAQTNFHGMPSTDESIVLPYLAQQFDTICNVLKTSPKQQALQLQQLLEKVPAGEAYAKLKESIELSVGLVADQKNLHLVQSQAAALAAGDVLDPTRSDGGRNLLREMKVVNFNVQDDTMDVGGQRYRMISRKVDFADEKLSPIASVDGGVTNRPIVTIDPNSQLLLSQANAIRGKVTKLSRQVDPIISLVSQQVIGAFPSSDEKKLCPDTSLPSNFNPRAIRQTPEYQTLYNRFRDPNDPLHLKVASISSLNPFTLDPYVITELRNGTRAYLPYAPLDEYITKGIGLCPQHALLTAYLLGDLVKQGQLPPGTVRNFRGTAYNLNAHAWAMYETADKRHTYLIDNSDHAQPVWIDLRTAEGPAQALAVYNAKGLNGLLEDVFNFYGITGHPAMTAIHPDALALVPETALENFQKADMLCPISGEIMHEPVCTNSGRIYDREYITQWCKDNEYKDPLTDEKITTFTPAPAKTKQIWAKVKSVAIQPEKGKGTPELKSKSRDVKAACTHFKKDQSKVTAASLPLTIELRDVNTAMPHSTVSTSSRVGDMQSIATTSNSAGYTQRIGATTKIQLGTTPSTTQKTDLNWNDLSWSDKLFAGILTGFLNRPYLTVGLTLTAIAITYFLWPVAAALAVGTGIGILLTPLANILINWIDRTCFGTSKQAECSTTTQQSDADAQQPMSAEHSTHTIIRNNDKQVVTGTFAGLIGAHGINAPNIMSEQVAPPPVGNSSPAPKYTLGS